MPPLLLPMSLLTLFVNQTCTLCVAETDVSSLALQLVYLLLYLTSTAASKHSHHKQTKRDTSIPRISDVREFLPTR